MQFLVYFVIFVIAKFLWKVWGQIFRVMILGQPRKTNVKAENDVYMNYTREV